MYAKDVPPGTIFYHGTKAELKAGDLLAPGYGSNFAERELSHIYFSATLEAATWGAELAKGAGRGRIYVVEPTGPFEDDPNLTDQKFPGNEARRPAGGRASTAVPLPTAAAIRCASPARSRIGSATPPSSCKR